MGQLIQFEERAVAQLRERLGAAEEANEDLVAFARGHSDAVASINCAVLEAIEAPCVEALLDVITGRWPGVLGIDFAAVALVVGDRAFRADGSGIERVEPAFVERILRGARQVEIDTVETGHALFGVSARNQIRAQALIRIETQPPYPAGLITLGQRTELAGHCDRGSQLLLFLGRVVGACIRRSVSLA